LSDGYLLAKTFRKRENDLRKATEIWNKALDAHPEYLGYFDELKEKVGSNPLPFASVVIQSRQIETLDVKHWRKRSISEKCKEEKCLYLLERLVNA
jgi:hypothetical protein